MGTVTFTQTEQFALQLRAEGMELKEIATAMNWTVKEVQILMERARLARAATRRGTPC